MYMVGVSIQSPVLICIKRGYLRSSFWGHCCGIILLNVIVLSLNLTEAFKESIRQDELPCI